MKALLNDWFSFLRGYYKNEYPDYILNKKISDEIPTFIYHHVEHDDFKSCLEHLKKNGYRTLCADECETRLSDGLRDKEVVITFDDGLSDVYDIAYPLLKEYGFKAVVFIIPHWIGKQGMITWDQVIEMHDSGVIDFQSHSLTHKAIFVSDQIIDFYGPHLKDRKPWNIPVLSNGYCNSGDNTELYGMPIYEFASRFSDHVAYIPDEDINQSCINYVANNSGDNFFNRKTWKQDLMAEMERLRGDPDAIQSDSQQSRAVFEEEDIQLDQIKTELEKSKAIIEQKLKDKRVSHFAFPWNEVGMKTLDLLPRLGYRTVYAGMKRINIPEQYKENLLIIRRVTGDFIKCLPGSGRTSFWRVLVFKMFRRFFRGVMY